MKQLFILLLFFTTQGLFSKTNTREWEGVASFYHNKFNGRKTFSGELFSNQKLTGANNFLPMGTYVKVTNLSNHLSVVVRINDHLHARNKRLIDLSLAAAKRLQFADKGTCRVKMEMSSKEEFKEEEVKDSQPTKPVKKKHRRHKRKHH